MESNIYIKKRFIDDASVSEIDFNFNQTFGFDYTIHDDIVEIKELNQAYSLDSEPIEIDRLISILQDLKKSGANYVMLESNCDHQGYDIEGYYITLATQEEIDMFLNLTSSKKKKNKDLEIKRLKEKLKKLRDEE